LEERPSFHIELIERIDWLVRLRWLAVVGTLAAILAADSLFPAVLPVGPLIAIVAAIALYNLAFLFYARRLEADELAEDRWQRTIVFAGAQIVLDLMALAALLHFSGGIENPCAMFFVLHVIIARPSSSQRWCCSSTAACFPTTLCRGWPPAASTVSWRSS